jgi:uncharacterized protein
MESCLYLGWARHRRRLPVAHSFRMPLFMVYLDLAEIDRVFRGRWLWSARRPALARFKRSDHLGDASVPLDTAVRDLVEQRTGARPGGAIRLLTHLRYFGYVFNPVSIYYCFDRHDTRVEAIVADVTNTPWGERHQYVMSVPVHTGRSTRHRLAKRFHVSPFLPMDTDYDWRFSDPGDRLTVHMVSSRNRTTMLDATLALRRTAISGAALASVLVAFPLMTVRVIVGIYWQALRLRLKGAPFYAHPRHIPADPAPTETPS